MAKSDFDAQFGASDCLTIKNTYCSAIFYYFPEVTTCVIRDFDDLFLKYCQAIINGFPV